MVKAKDGARALMSWLGVLRMFFPRALIVQIGIK